MLHVALGYQEFPSELGWAETFTLGSESKSWCMLPLFALCLSPCSAGTCCGPQFSCRGHAAGPLLCPAYGVEACWQDQCPHAHLCGGQGLYSLLEELLLTHQHQQRESIIPLCTLGPLSSPRTSFCNASSVP